MRENTKFWNLPNAITVLRIVLVPVILAFYLGRTAVMSPVGSEIMRYTALFFYLIATFSDLFDGYFARRRKEVSDVGKLLDPLADKFLALSLMVVFSSEGSLPIWYTIVFIWREFAITTMRGVAISDGVAIAASSAGKKKTVYLNIGLGFLFPSAWVVTIAGYTFSATRPIAFVMLAIALYYCLSSAWQYLRAFYQSNLR